MDLRAVDGNDRRFFQRLRTETGVVVTPGSTISPATAGFVRLDLSVPGAALATGLERMAGFATSGSAV